MRGRVRGWALVAVLSIVAYAAGAQMNAQAAKEAVAAGDPVVIEFTFRGPSTTPCFIPRLLDGSLSVTSLTRDGHAVSPLKTVIDFAEGVGVEVRDSLTTISSTDPVTLVWSSEFDDATGGQAFRTIGIGRNDASAARFFPVDKPGRYALNVLYSTPNVEGLPSAMCPDSSIDVHFTRSSTHAPRGSLGFAEPNGLHVGANESDAFKQKYNDCINKFKAPGGDPKGIIGPLTAPTATHPHVVRESKNVVNQDPNSSHATDKGDAQNGTGSGSTISWRPEPGASADGTPSDPCATLYHELYHSYDMERGALDETVNSDGSKKSEVDATDAENAYRGGQGLPLRPSYGGVLLPHVLPGSSDLIMLEGQIRLAPKVPRKPSGAVTNSGLWKLSEKEANTTIQSDSEEIDKELGTKERLKQRTITHVENGCYTNFDGTNGGTFPANLKLTISPKTEDKIDEGTSSFTLQNLVIAKQAGAGKQNDRLVGAVSGSGTEKDKGEVAKNITISGFISLYTEESTNNVEDFIIRLTLVVAENGADTPK